MKQNGEISAVLIAPFPSVNSSGFLLAKHAKYQNIFFQKLSLTCCPLNISNVINLINLCIGCSLGHKIAPRKHSSTGSVHSCVLRFSMRVRSSAGGPVLLWNLWGSVVDSKLMETVSQRKCGKMLFAPTPLTCHQTKTLHKQFLAYFFILKYKGVISLYPNIPFKFCCQILLSEFLGFSISQ